MTAIISFFGQRNRTREPASQAELRSDLDDLFNAAERHVWTPDPTPLPLATVAHASRIFA
jgi:hypothetical protein